MDDVIKQEFAKKILDKYNSKERVTILEGELALCVTHLLELVEKPTNNAARYKEALEDIQKAINENCQRAAGMGSNTMLAIATTSKIVDDVLKED